MSPAEHPYRAAPPPPAARRAWGAWAAVFVIALGAFAGPSACVLALISGADRVDGTGMGLVSREATPLLCFGAPIAALLLVAVAFRHAASRRARRIALAAGLVAVPLFFRLGGASAALHASWRARCGGGDGRACATIARSYEHGYNERRDPTRAAALYRRACGLGDLWGCRDLVRAQPGAREFACRQWAAQCEHRPASARHYQCDNVALACGPTGGAVAH